MIQLNLNLIMSRKGIQFSEKKVNETIVLVILNTLTFRTTLINLKRHSNKLKYHTLSQFNQ